jgi:Flp pilus assembly protein TadG
MSPRISQSGVFAALLRQRRGSALLQFALIAPVFFALVFMIVDDGLAMFTQATLDNATRDASRNILLGTYQKNGNTVGNFRTAVCDEMGGLIPDCTNNLLVYTTASSTGFATAAQNLNSNPLPGSDGTWSIGGSGDYVIIQTGYNRPYIPYVGSYVSGGSLLLVSTILFQTEPY